MPRVDVNAMMQQVLHAANNRLNLREAVARAPAAAPLLDVGSAGVQAVEKSTEEVKMLSQEATLQKLVAQTQQLNIQASQMAAAMQGATTKATGGSK